MPRIVDRNGRQATGADGLAERQKLETKLTSGRSLPNTSSWVRGDRERGLMVHYCCHAVDVLCAAQDEHGCGLEVKWRESLHARDSPQAYTGWVSLFEDAPARCLRSRIGSHDTLDDELAGPSRAADDVARSERVCRCSRQSRAFTLDEGGAQGVDCSCVAAVDALGHLSTAVQHARLVGTAAWQCGPTQAG